MSMAVARTTVYMVRSLVFGYISIVTEVYIQLFMLLECLIILLAGSVVGLFMLNSVVDSSRRKFL
jgi:hypothetical protein